MVAGDEAHLPGNPHKYDDLLCPPAIIDPMAVEGGEEKGKKHKIRRETGDYDAAHHRFRTLTKEYSQQYAPLYYHRLQKMRPRLLQAAKERWEGKLGVSSSSSSTAKLPRIVNKILELRADEEVIVAGTLYKEMPLRPNILESYAKERSIIPPPLRSNYVSEKDRLIIEDESGRISLVGVDLPTDLVVTGIIVAIRGVELKDGDFQVDDIIFTGIPMQLKRPILEKDKYVALVSGINIGEEVRNPLAVQLMVDYLSGHIGGAAEQEFESRISRLIIAGNSLVPPEEKTDGAAVKNYQKRLTPQAQARLLRPIQELEQVLCQLAASMHVDIMPGAGDPANFVLPQQPFNPCLFPTASRYATFSSVTNPYQCRVDGLFIVGHSGQPVDDIKKYIDPSKTDTLRIMEDTLNWSHLAPTTPDTLGAYPFSGEDPFVLDECPHIYFAANQATYDSKLITGPKGQVVRLISVPSFTKTSTIVLVNLKTLATHPITFNADLDL